MSMPLYHVSHVVRGSLVGPRSVRYFSVAAPNAASALGMVENALGSPVAGEFSIQRSEGTSEVAGILREQSASQLAA